MYVHSFVLSCVVYGRYSSDMNEYIQFNEWMLCMYINAFYWVNFDREFPISSSQ